MLAEAGLSVRTAVNGALGVELYNQWRPDLVFMDLRMPVMGGIEAAKRIHDLRFGSEPKIVLAAHFSPMSGAAGTSSPHHSASTGR